MQIGYGDVILDVSGSDSFTDICLMLQTEIA
jgi:hypothetical protein